MSTVDIILVLVLPISFLFFIVGIFGGWAAREYMMNYREIPRPHPEMFDINGNIATNNSTHFFYIKNKCVYTSTGKYCVKGITRKKVVYLCKKNKIKVYEKNFKLKVV